MSLAIAIYSGEDWLEIRYLSFECSLHRELLDFLIFFGVLSDLGFLMVESKTVLLEMEAAWLRRKLVACSRIDVEAFEDEDDQRCLISGRSFDVISSNMSIPSLDQMILWQLFSIIGAVTRREVSTFLD